jgi:hypothetical protein
MTGLGALLDELEAMASDELDTDVVLEDDVC